nr:GNAT family N-acetyltransferase [Tissierella sp.]
MEVDILNIIYDSQQYLDSVALRNEVFRKPHGLDIKDDDLSEDESMDMYGAYIEGKLIGTVFLKENDSVCVQIKAVGILDEFRGIGLGRYLLEFIENLARKRGYSQAKLMARVSCKDFYIKLGYEAISEPYNYKTIPHLDMTKSL